MLTVVLAACSSSGGPAAGPNPSGSINPGPNPTSVTNPGPNSTVKGPETIGGALRVVGTCAQVVLPGTTPQRYELVPPQGWHASASGLVVDGQLVAHPGDQVYLTGHRLSTDGRCGRKFAADHLVSVVAR